MLRGRNSTDEHYMKHMGVDLVRKDRTWNRLSASIWSSRVPQDQEGKQARERLPASIWSSGVRRRGKYLHLIHDLTSRTP
jgi:hypothetical protein